MNIYDDKAKKRLLRKRKKARRRADPNYKPKKFKGTLRQRKDGGITEYQLQCEVVKWLRGEELCFTCGQEGFHKTAGARQKAHEQGMEAGQPDLTIFLEGGKTLFIELKIAKGSLSQSQKDRHEVLKEKGFEVMVVKTDCHMEAVRLIKAACEQ